MKVLASGGGTGGHVYPILAVMNALEQLASAASRGCDEGPICSRGSGEQSAQPGSNGATPAAATRGLPCQRPYLPANLRPVAGRATPIAEACSSARMVAAARPSLAGAEFRGPAAPDATAFRPGGTRAASDCEVRYVGQSDGIEESLVRRAGASFVSIATGQIRGRSPWVVLRNALRMARGVQECTALIDDFRPDVIFITGGYVTVPLAVAAWRSRRRVPLLIYLPDLTPGLAVRWTSYLAARVAVSFPEVAHYFPGKAVVTGYPVRQELLAADKQATAGSAEAGRGAGRADLWRKPRRT